MEQPTITVTESKHDAPKAPAENPRAADARRSARPHEVVASVVGSLGEKPKVTSTSGAVHVTSYSKGPTGRSFTDHQKQMLENLDKFGDVKGKSDNAGTTITVREGSRGEPPAETKQDQAPAAKQGEPAQEPSSTPAPAAESKPDAKVEARPEAKPEPAAKAEPDAELSSRIERLTEHNRRLAAENEQLRGGKYEPDERLKALDQIEETWTTDPIGALRKLVALNAGLKEDSPEVDRLLSHAYADWTGVELKVPIDPGRRGEIESARNRLLIERDRRKRDSEAARIKAEAEAEQGKQRVTEQVNSLGQRLKEEKHDGKFPLMMEHSQMFDGLRPEQLLFSVIRRGIAAGEFDKDTPDDKLIAHYSAEIEKYYKPRYDKLKAHFETKLEPHFKEKFATTTSAPSTATPAQASESKTEPVADTHQAGVRTITNASASVAPPAPPAAAAPPAKNDTPPPKFRNEDERRRHFARLRFGDE